MKKIISFLIVLSIIFQLAVTIDASEPTDYRGVGYLVSKPKAQFSLTIKRGEEIIGKATSPVGDTLGQPTFANKNLITARVGDTFDLADMSNDEFTKGTISEWDFQVYGPNLSHKVIYKDTFEALNTNVKKNVKFDEKGTYNFFLCVKANTPPSYTNSWANWSHNGNHQTLSPNGEFLWYFTQIRVVVEEAKPKADFQILYNGEDVTDNITKPIQRSGNSLQVTLKDKSTITGGTIVKREWKFYNTNHWKELPRQGTNDLTIEVSSAEINASPNKILFYLRTTSNTGETSWKEHQVHSVLAPAEIIVHHVNTNGKPVDTDDYVTATPGVATIVYSKAIEGYLASKTSDTVTVPIGQTRAEYTFIYNANITTGKIIIHHKDADGNPVAASDPFYVALDTPTEVFSKVIANHTPNKTSDMVTVPSSDPDKLVEYTFIYTKNPPPVNPPYVWIDSPNIVVMGNDINIKARGTDPTNSPITYTWEGSPSYMLEGTLDDEDNTVWFNREGVYSPTLTGSSVNGTDTDTKEIIVLPATPNTIMTAQDRRVNHKITADASTSTSKSQRFPIDWTKSEWEISIEDNSKGLTLDDIKTLHTFTLGTNSNGQPVIKIEGDLKKIELLSKKEGKINILCTLYTTAGYSSFSLRTVNIGPDLPPVADYYSTAEAIRDPNDNNHASIDLVDLSYSPDGDAIGKRVWLYAFDWDNDGSFLDEVWYVYDNGTWQPVTNYGIDGSYPSLKNLNINLIDDGNKPVVLLKLNHVGRYAVDLIVAEQLDSTNSIPAFINASDIQAADTLGKKR